MRVGPVVLVGVATVALLGGCTSPADDTGVPPASITSPPGADPVTTAAPAPAPPRGDGARARVTSVTDGDTIDVVVAGGGAETVRLVGINAPETGECFAAEASAALADLVEARDVRLVADQSDRDQYDRLLRYVFVGDAFVNEALVRGGFAQAYRYEPDTARADQLDAAQAAAEAAGRGLWAADACGPDDPAATALAIDRIVADPPGDDTLDPNAEYVVVANRGTAPVDLTGWGLKDESASHRFTFPSGFELAAGAQVSVHTGCGAPTATDLFWCNQGSAVWNNDGDTAFLLDPNGNVVDTRAY